MPDPIEERATEATQTPAQKKAAAAEKRAEKIKKELARAEERTKKKKTSAKVQLRNSLILARHAQKVSNELIAAEVGVGLRQVQRVIAEGEEIRSPLEETPMKLIEDLALQYQLAAADFAAMSIAFFDTNQQASISAKKAEVEVRRQLMELLGDLGKLPDNLETFKSEMQMQRIAEEMGTMMRSVAAGDRDPSEAVDFFQQLLQAASTGAPIPSAEAEDEATV